jgi:uncharacterized protein
MNQIFTEGNQIGDDYHFKEIIYQNGVLFEERNYMNGELHGKRFIYYPNGQKEWDYNYKNGFMHGKNYLFKENGKMDCENNYLSAKENNLHL